MNVLVIGNKGNMGRRYSAILRDFTDSNVEGIDDFGSHDLDTRADYLLLSHTLIKAADKIIIATPTHTHHHIIRMIAGVADRKIDVLCEKPIATDPLQLIKIEEDTVSVNLFMVNQYCYCKELVGGGEGITSYNYYQSGPDGLIWDCIQLIGLANGKIHLSQSSPVWSSWVNGNQLKRSTLDGAYVDMIIDFVGPQTKCWGWEKIKEVHKKVFNAIKYQGVDRDSGEVIIYPPAKQMQPYHQQEDDTPTSH